MLNVTVSSGAPVASCTLAGDAIVGQPTFVDGSGSTDWEGAALAVSNGEESSMAYCSITASDP